MRRMRSGVLIAAAVTLIGLPAFPLAAQVAPTLTGETGLIELTNADMIPQGRFAFGLFFSQSDRTAGPSLKYGPGTSDPLRYGYGKLGVTAAFGATDTIQIFAGAGERFFAADPRDWSGVIDGHDRTGRVRHSETDKFHFGAKILLNPKVDLVKVVLFGGWSIPTQAKSDSDALSTYRADYDFGVSFNYGVATFQTQYVIMGDLGEDFDVPNELRFGLGFGIPIVRDTLKVIGEVNRVHFDGGTTKPGDYSEALLGARFGMGRSGFAATGAVRVNIDRWIKYGNKPSNIGGVVALAWSPQPASAVAASAPAAGSPEEPAPETPATTTSEPPRATAPADAAPVAPAPQPTSAEPPPPARPETSTTDEVLFDAAKSRLTNIAKAILDGVALRLKNNLAATCTVTGYADKAEKGDHDGLSRGRSEAAKDYLVKRHGIDAGRIKTDARGDAEAGSDAVRNRRAVVSVTFP